MRELSELTNVPDPAWPLVQKAAAASSVRVALLPGDAFRGAACLRQLQVTARSFLGAVALHSGGILVDGGWVRVYGGAGTGAPGGLPGLATVNGFPPAPDPAWSPPTGGLVLAHDVLGGVFALNGHDPAAAGRPGDPAEMVYFAPDLLAWEPLGVGHGDWLSWLLAGDALAEFYSALRWPGWPDAVAGLPLSHGMAVYPFLWSEEANGNTAGLSRSPVPMHEILGSSRDFARQAGGADPGPLGALEPLPAG